ncbi:MAG: molybdenum cofactor biosynthesis protein MoaE [Nitriliruptorales bacterium]|nr:molybdenum cofactor biosynthesis protein MoaE [Nitriliruptorales bacterium]
MATQVAARLHARLTDVPLSAESAHSFCADPSAGATVVFTGMVRNHSEGRAVRGLTYEAYGERAQVQLDALADEVTQRYPAATAVWLEHRTGDLAVGETAVVVGVSAGHRDDAFVAARWAIDELKSNVAIWKQEHWATGGTSWPGSPD